MVETFLEKIEQMLSRLEEKFGEVQLFAIFKMDEVTDKWSIIVGATWADDTKRREAFSFLIEQMREHLDDEEKYSIARIGVISSQDHLIKLMLDEFRTGDVVSSDRKVNGNVVHEGHVLKSERQN